MCRDANHVFVQAGGICPDYFAGNRLRNETDICHLKSEIIYEKIMIF